MQPRFTLLLGTLGLAAALVAAPVGVQDNIASLHEKSAFAKNGGGHGRGRGGGKGRGNISSAAVHGGGGPGKSGSAPGHGGTGHGHAVGHDGVSGVSSHSAHMNGNSYSDLQGNLNAAHASAQAFANAAADSMVGEIAEAVRASSDLDPGEVITRGDIGPDFAAELGAISNKVDDPNDPVAPGVADAVRDLVDGKVSEPPAP